MHDIFLTARSLSQTLHDDVELGEGQDAVFVLVEEHEDFLELGHLLVRELPFVEVDVDDEVVLVLFTLFPFLPLALGVFDVASGCGRFAPGPREQATRGRSGHVRMRRRTTLFVLRT